MIYEEDGVRQGNTQIALSKIVREFSEKETNKQLVYSEPEVILNIKDKIESNYILSEQLVSLLIKMRRKVVEQPLKYIQIASNERREEEIRRKSDLCTISWVIYAHKSSRKRNNSNEKIKRDSSQYLRTHEMHLL